MAAMGEAAAPAVAPGFNEFAYAVIFGAGVRLTAPGLSSATSATCAGSSGSPCRCWRMSAWCSLLTIPWDQVAARSWSGRAWTTSHRELLTMVVAVFGTTISPYMFFWQSSQEIEDPGPGVPQQSPINTPHLADGDLRRIRLDTWLGMGISSLIAFFIILTTSVTPACGRVTQYPDLVSGGRGLATDRRRPRLLAVQPGHHRHRPARGARARGVPRPTRWPSRRAGRMGLDRQDRGQGQGFYGMIAAATLGGVVLNFTARPTR